jgi:hypothetical protein
MLFWASSEVFRLAAPASEVVRRGLEPLINDGISRSALASLDCTFRYIPIIMPDGMRERYPARSKLRRKERICVCAPQLDYETFVTGSLEEQLREYVCGIETMVPRLSDLGASLDQVSEFEAILSAAVARILQSDLRATRH